MERLAHIKTVLMRDRGAIAYHAVGRAEVEWLVSEVATLNASLASMQRKLDKAKQWADRFAALAQEATSMAEAAESRVATLHRGREAMREALDAMATAGRALYEEGAGEGDPRAQEALWTVGKRLYETACDMAATLSEPQPEALSQPTRKPSNG